MTHSVLFLLHLQCISEITLIYHRVLANNCEALVVTAAVPLVLKYFHNLKQVEEEEAGITVSRISDSGTFQGHSPHVKSSGGLTGSRHPRMPDISTGHSAQCCDPSLTGPLY